MGRSGRDRTICVALLAGLLLVLRVLAGDAVAQPAAPAPADEAFARGREALQIGKYDVACAAFEESQRLAPQLLTQFNIALCDEQLGKLATALALHKELATKDDNPPRRAKAADMAAQLEARVPRLRIEIVQRGGDALVPPGLEVTVGGVHATNFKDMPIDLGTTRVVARAPGFLEWTGDVRAKDERQRVKVTIKLERDPAISGPVEPEVAPKPTPAEPAAAPQRSVRGKLGVAAVIGGGAAIASGITFGFLARSKWHDAREVCGGGTTCTTQIDLDRGQAMVDQARSRGRIATALVVAGGVLVTTGVVLWVTAPKAERSLAVAPAASSSSVGLALLGRF